MQEKSTTLEADVEKVQNESERLRVENAHARTALGDMERRLQCQICYSNVRDVVILPCSHFMFCKQCIERHVNTSQARTCPVCRGTISGLLALQLDP